MRVVTAALVCLILASQSICTAQSLGKNEDDQSLYTLEDTPASNTKTATAPDSEVDTDSATSFLDLTNQRNLESAPIFEDK